ncbi:Protein PDB1.1 b [Aphelenchoides avenae]|nr:Protein PDB1.1 b [Aphelenchus avenae]
MQNVLPLQIGPMVDWKTIAIMLTGTSLKLILFILYNRHNTTSSNVLAQDQRNDVLTNSFALVGAYIGHHYWLYADPVGALVLCAYIIANWLKTAQEQVPLLIGKAADGAFTNPIAKIAIAHDERILALDTIYVYHLGVNYLVELHVKLC